MSTTTTATTTATTEGIEQGVATLKLRPATEEKKEEEYRYAHLLPHFSVDRYPPLTPFEHVDPGHRALSHPNPLAFLEGASVVDEITPHLGTEVVGVNLAELDSTGRDQLALEVRRRLSPVWEDMLNLKNRLPEGVSWCSVISKISLTGVPNSIVNGVDILDGQF